MACRDFEMHHIVDVDGQLLAIEAEVIDTASLLAKANRPPHLQLWLVRAGEHIALQPNQLLRLSRDEVLFFETNNASRLPAFDRLAA